MKLNTPFQLGPMALAHRIVMPPLTRMRAGAADGVQTPLAATYYGQRATQGGLIIAEATQISQQGQGYPQTPGIYTQPQVQGWSKVVQAVKQQGAHFILQLWHVGRVSHSSIQEGGQLPVAPSAIAPAGNAFTNTFARVPHEVPHALEMDEIQSIVADYKRAAENAKKAGFDGVEIHAANGYLLQQFLEDRSNQRTDAYGGSIENRARLLFEVLDAVAQVWAIDRIGVRLSPYSDVGDMADSDPGALYAYVIDQLAKQKIGYLHLIEPQVRAGLGGELNAEAPASVCKIFRPLFSGPLIASGGFTAENAEAVLSAGDADLVAFGRMFIANPDLPKRLISGAELNAPDPKTFYGGAEKGYTDYTTLDAVTV
jgi:N-ethylmaleimide reductase